MKFKLTAAVKKVFNSEKSGRGVFRDAHRYLTSQGVPRSLNGSRLGLRKRMLLHDAPEDSVENSRGGES
jgi:hypothetical protein